MFCTKCGKNVDQNDKVCSGCGAIVLRPETEKKENIVLAIVALVFSIICPCVGLLLGMVGVSVYNTPKFKNLSARAIVISVSLFIVLCVTTIFLFSII